ncbi:hypothetical protein Scep_002480 [Stephania cephalantha]|uniref:Tetratricopeptide repeat protein 33 n=1 Tax=Stephania cephalantha TaxID=152367 RepID=A0AAP0Q5Z4_9MAGN
MKIAWKKTKKEKKRSAPLSRYPNLPFETEDESTHAVLAVETLASSSSPPQSDELRLFADSFQSQGTKFAEEGRFQEALGKWEAALTIMPERAILHEQKAQVLLEIGDTWNALKAATRATELEPTWAEAWITLGRAQLNFGEPDAAIESFDRTLVIKPDCEEVKDDRQTALHLVKRRKQLHLSGLSTSESRYSVKDKEIS